MEVPSLCLPSCGKCCSEWWSCSAVTADELWGRGYYIRWACDEFLSPMMETRNCPGTRWKIEGLKLVGDFFLACKSALLPPGVMEGKRIFPCVRHWHWSDWQSVKLFWPGELEKALKTAEYLQPFQQCCKAETHGKYMLLCTSNEREIMQHPPWEEFELQCPWLCGASILYMKSSEAMSLGSNVMLKSGFTLHCKIYQGFCLKGTDLQEDAWSAYLIWGNRQCFPLFFYSFALVFVCVCRICCGN